MPREPQSCAWIRALAAPYLRGYRARAESHGPLRGYWFLARGQGTSRNSPRKAKSAGARCGFFVGYLEDAAAFEFLHPHPPECLVFAILEPVNGAAHRRLVVAEGSLLRHTAEYIRWLTHRPPHFEFFDNQSVTLVRHFSMREWPIVKHHHFSRNFFIETLAWLVRSGLVKKLAAPPASTRKKVRSGRAKA